jgi:hypothetical protein
MGINARAWFNQQSFAGRAEESTPAAPNDALDVAEQLRCCATCGEPAAELFLVDDSDYNVGYHDAQELCAECIRGYGLRRRSR